MEYAATGTHFNNVAERAHRILSWGCRGGRQQVISGNILAWVLISCVPQSVSGLGRRNPERCVATRTLRLRTLSLWTLPGRVWVRGSEVFRIFARFLRIYTVPELVSSTEYLPFSRALKVPNPFGRASATAHPHDLPDRKARVSPGLKSLRRGNVSWQASACLLGLAEWLVRIFHEENRAGRRVRTQLLGLGPVARLDSSQVELRESQEHTPKAEGGAGVVWDAVWDRWNGVLGTASLVRAIKTRIGDTHEPTHEKTAATLAALPAALRLGMSRMPSSGP